MNTPESELSFLDGGGEMGALMRQLDWSKTVLGPPAQWSASLRMMVSFLLANRFPLLLWWGPDYISIYNDAYRPILGDKHPKALGQPVRECWHEIWNVLQPLIDAPFQGGPATWMDDIELELARHGFLEETHFTIAYSPVPDPNAPRGIGGVMATVHEITEKVIGQRRVGILSELGARSGEVKTLEQACLVATETLSQHAKDVPFLFMYLLEASDNRLRLVGQLGSSEYAAPAVVPLESPQANSLWPLATVLGTENPQVVDALAPRMERARAGEELPRRAVVLPIKSNVVHKPAGVLVVGASARIPLDAQYLAFLELLTSQIATALANAREFEAERHRVEALAEIDRAKTIFFSNVSHEFRTPLTLMLGPIEDVIADARVTSEVREPLELARRNAHRLLKLVNSLLDFARIEAGRIEANYEATDLAGFTAELASGFRSAIEKAGLKLIVNCPAVSEPTYVDRDMWEKIVLNLLSNAFKFTFDGEIEVALHSRDEQVELSVRDTGVGVPRADLPKLFQRFHRVTNTRSRTHEGSGIGLALVQELARLHGGEASVSSVEGQGTTITVRIASGVSHLPAERLSAPRTLASTHLGAKPFIDEALRWLPQGSAGAPGSAAPAVPVIDDVPAGATPHPQDFRARVLVADDNADLREYLQRLLERTYEVHTVADGAAALESLRTARPDLVLADVMMPHLDGFALVTAIRADQSARGLPVILLSARAGEEARIEGLQAGADDYVTKPFSARELLARVSSQLELARVRREAEEAVRHRSEQFVTLLNAAPLGVYLVDADFRIREMNPIARPVFGEIPGGVIGRDFAEIIHILWEEEYADEIVRIFRHTLRTGEPYVMPERAEFRRDRGVTEYYEWRLDRITLPDGRFGVVCYFRDISTQVLARVALQDADRRKDEFLATLAHELRNPLAPLKNGIQILKVARGQPAALERTRDMMERQINQMVRLIDDLLEVSRISHGKVMLNKAHVDLASIIYRSIETSQPLLDEMKHELAIELPAEAIRFQADPIRLAQVLANLVNNACKFTPKGGKVQIRAELQRSSTDGTEWVSVSVKDSGIGIAAEALPQVFELFVQGDRTLERSRGGLGIGLTLVRRLVDLHGGTVEARSGGIGCGSEFVIRLPLNEELTPAAGNASVASEIVRSSHRRRILVVDDNRDAAESLSMMLSDAGHEVRTTFDGLSALEIADAFQPEVIILDVAMPGLNGYDAARRLRDQAGGGERVLIALTGFGYETDRRRAEQSGFDAHLVKPVDFATLQRTLTSVARAKSL